MLSQSEGFQASRRFRLTLPRDIEQLEEIVDSSAPFRSNDGLTSASTECSRWQVMFCIAQVRTFGPEDRMHFTLIRVQLWTSISPNLLSDLSPG